MLWIKPLATRYWCNCSAAERGSAAHRFKSPRGISRGSLARSRWSASLLPFDFLISRRAYDYEPLVRSRCRS